MLYWSVPYDFCFFSVVPVTVLPVVRVIPVVIAATAAAPVPLAPVLKGEFDCDIIRFTPGLVSGYLMPAGHPGPGDPAQSELSGPGPATTPVFHQKRAAL